MAKKSDFAAKFVDAQPATAARVMESLVPADVSAFVDLIPDKLSSKALASMLPIHAARCLEGLTDEAAARYLKGLRPRTIAMIVHYLESARRRSVLGFLSGTTALHVGILLRYPRNAVGAWMDPATPILRENCSVSEALQQLRHYDLGDRPEVFLIDEETRIRGVVTLDKLVWADPGAKASDLAEPAAYFLQAASKLTTASDHDGWKKTDRIPVLDRTDQLVGVLRHVDLRTGLAADVEAPIEPKGMTASDGHAIAEFWYIGLAETLNAVMNSRDDTSSPVKSE